MSDIEIIKEGKGNLNKSVLNNSNIGKYNYNFIWYINIGTRGKSSDKNGVNLNNEWIPTEAVRVI